ncbi:hypothetical protein V8J82_21180 [Gymnodinialimonas sp. 2305UL16-5]|uniref:hypothetical protein n=1 Tax=Gymnodinialimonas mytili TaxID=3126503 RepID=UPI0030A1DA4A
MTIRISILALAALLLITVLAALSSAAHAYAVDQIGDQAVTATDMLSTGPLNIVVSEVSQR